MGTVSPLPYVSSEFFPIVSLTCNSDQGTGVTIYFRVRPQPASRAQASVRPIAAIHTDVQPHLTQCCALGAWLSVEGWEKRQDEDGEDAADAGGWEAVSYFFTSAWNAGLPRSGSQIGLTLRSLQATGNDVHHFGSWSSVVSSWPKARSSWITSPVESGSRSERWRSASTAANACACSLGSSTD